MDPNKLSLSKFTELVNLRRIEADLWNTLEKLLHDARVHGYLEQVNLKHLVKINKSMNNMLMKMIVKTTEESPTLTAPLPSTTAPLAPPGETESKENDHESYIMVENV